MRKIIDEKNDKLARNAVIVTDEYGRITVTLPSEDIAVTRADARKLHAFGDGLLAVETLIFDDARGEYLDVEATEDEVIPLALSGKDYARIDAAVGKLKLACEGDRRYTSEAACEKARETWERVSGLRWVTLAMLASEDDEDVRAEMARWNGIAEARIRADKIHRRATAIAKLHYLDRWIYVGNTASRVADKVSAIMADPVRFKRLPARTRAHLADKLARNRVRAGEADAIRAERSAILATLGAED